jgi:hypothetical protein
VGCGTRRSATLPQHFGPRNLDVHTNFFFFDAYSGSETSNSSRGYSASRFGPGNFGVHANTFLFDRCGDSNSSYGYSTTNISNRVTLTCTQHLSSRGETSNASCGYSTLHISGRGASACLQHLFFDACKWRRDCQSCCATILPHVSGRITLTCVHHFFFDMCGDSDISDLPRGCSAPMFRAA